jgi:hypothetical protein
MIRKITSINAVLVVLLAAGFFIYPAIRAALDIGDPALRQPGVPKAGLILLVVGGMLPVLKRKIAPTGVEDWPDARPSARSQAPHPPATVADS